MKFRHLLFPLAVAFSPAVLAASDGSLGEESRGQTEVTLAVPKLVQVSVEGDITIPFTTTGGTGASTGLCIYSKETASVDVTLTTLNGSFDLDDGTGSTIAYSAALRNSGGTIGGFTYNTPLDVSDANTTATDCGGAGTYPHSLDLSVAQAAINAASSGTYQDTIYITVAAE